MQKKKNGQVQHRISPKKTLRHKCLYPLLAVQYYYNLQIFLQKLERLETKLKADSYTTKTGVYRIDKI